MSERRSRPGRKQSPECNRAAVALRRVGGVRLHAAHLRRLEPSLALRPGAGNPFESARKARAERLLRVGFHAATASAPGSSSEWLLDALRTPWSHRAIEISPIYGMALRWLPKTHRFQFIKRRSGGHEAVSRSAIERGSKVVGHAE